MYILSIISIILASLKKIRIKTDSNNKYLRKGSIIILCITHKTILCFVRILS